MERKTKMKKAGLYCRVSTRGQTTENQRLQLEEYCQRQKWRVAGLYEDVGISGSKDDRPAFGRMMKDAEAGKLDVVVVWKIDRLARSTAHLLNTITELKEWGVGFAASTQGISTESSAGRMLTTFLGAIAEFERELIVERVKAGIDRVRSEGVKLGRPRVGFDVAEALRLRDEQGLGYKQVARHLGVARTTVYRTLRAIPKNPAAIEGGRGIPQN